MSAHKPSQSKSVSPLSEFCNQELRHNSIFVLVTVDWGTSLDIAVSHCSFPECAILNFCYSWMGDAKFDPSWCLRWVSSPRSLSWSVAWLYTIGPRVIRDCDNRHSSQLIFLLSSFKLVNQILWVTRDCGLSFHCHDHILYWHGVMVSWLTWCHYQPFGHRLCGVGMADHALCVRLLSANCGGMLTCDVSSQLNALSVSGYPGLHAECLGSLATRHHTWSVSLYLYSWVLPPFIHRHISCSVPWNEPPFTDESQPLLRWMDTRMSQCAQFTEYPGLSVWGDMDMGMLSGGFRPVFGQILWFWLVKAFLSWFLLAGSYEWAPCSVNEGPVFKGSLFIFQRT